MTYLNLKEPLLAILAGRFSLILLACPQLHCRLISSHTRLHLLVLIMVGCEPLESQTRHQVMFLWK